MGDWVSSVPVTHFFFAEPLSRSPRSWIRLWKEHSELLVPLVPLKCEFPARHGGTPIAGWFARENPNLKLDDDKMGYPHDELETSSYKTRHGMGTLHPT